MRPYANLAVLMAMLVLGLGVALLAVTLAEGGGETGILLGVLFLVLGSGRLYLARHR